jgi:hypothetical protein
LRNPDGQNGLFALESNAHDASGPGPGVPLTRYPAGRVNHGLRSLNPAGLVQPFNELSIELFF